MTDATHNAASLIKSNKRKIATFLNILAAGPFDSAQLELMYDVLGYDFDAYVASLVTDLTAKDVSLDADFAAL